MKQNRIFNAILLAFFLLILIVPILLINLVPDAVSQNENRSLAKFPDIIDDSGSLNDGLKSGIESWLNDRIGFREQFLQLTAKIKVNMFHISTSEKVHIGKDGWYFYTYDNNLEIASGDYPLTEEMLAEIAEKQQAISNYYQEQGKQYILILTPSKASVYPEYIGGADYHVGTSPCDIIEEYLRKNTDVQVVNVKTANVDAKDEGQQFLKTDTHWTQLGSYTAYCAIVDYLKSQGILTTDSIYVSFTETQVRGEFSAMLGSQSVLPLETTSKAGWDSHATFIKDGDWFEAMENLRKNNSDAKNNETVLLENEEIGKGTLLIYGDSQWNTPRNIPQLMSEHFHHVVMSRIRSVNISMDQIVDPDVVIYGCSERMISSLLCRDLTIPVLCDDIPSLSEQPAQTSDDWIGTQGMCLDQCNGKNIHNADIVQIDEDAAQVSFVGWAADFNDLKPLTALYLQVGDQVIKCNYGIERTSVSDHFGNEELKNTGFTVAFPTSYLRDGQVEELQFVQISADGNSRYEPVVYQLQYS